MFGLHSAFNQHEFLKGGTAKQTEDAMLATLKESISVPGRMICLLHPWQDPVPFRRVWCLYELHTAFTLGAQVMFQFPPKVHVMYCVPAPHAHT